MAVDDSLDLDRIDIEPRADNQFLAAAHDMQCIILALPDHVPGVEPAVFVYHFGCALSIAVVALHHSWAAHMQLAYLAMRDGFAIGIDNANLDAGDGLANRAIHPGRIAPRLRDCWRNLGKAVAIMQRQSVSGLDICLEPG